jgi:hypothetical protein
VTRTAATLAFVIVILSIALLSAAPSQTSQASTLPAQLSDLARQVEAGMPLVYPAILAPLKDPATIDVP